MSSSSIIDDVANLRHVPEVLALAGEGELPLERLRRIACGSATRADVEQFRRRVDEDARRPAAGWLNGGVPDRPARLARQYASVEMRVEVRAARPGDGAGLARVWLENASYYVGLFPDDFRMPDQAGLVESFEVRLVQPRSASELRLVAVVDGVVAAFVDVRLTDPDDGAAWEMLADRPYRRVHVEALGTADAFQRQGLATQLVEAVEAWAREQGARFISAGTYLESPVAIPFWEQRMGYRRRSVILAKRLE